MAKISLTDMGVQKPTAGTYFDARTPAFGIRVGKHRKTWIATKGKDRRVITLGHYPAVSLSDARKRAYKVFLAPEEARSTITFPEAKEAYLAQEKWRSHSRRVLTSSLKHFTWTCRLTKVARRCTCSIGCY